MKVVPIAGALGAEIHGVDLAAELTPARIAEIRTAWLEYGVVFFREQRLDSDAFMRLGNALGTPVEYPFVRGLPGYPYIIEVKKLEHERTNFGGMWHTDTSYLECPPAATMLLARELPPYGGDTEFASGIAAFEALSPGLKATLVQLKGVNSSAKADVTKSREDRIASDGRAEARTVYEAEHPVVRTHPETGRKSLYVNCGHTVRFAGWTEEESAPLLDLLFRHLQRAEFTCRFVWRPGSLALWDNRSVLHNPVNDYHGFRRVMHRITLAGDRPR